MIDLKKLLNNDTLGKIPCINSGGGILRDIVIWKEKYLKYISNSNLSGHTERSYEFILNALVGYCKDILHQKKAIKHLSDLDVSEINNFLTYLESYSINKEYGQLDRRLEILFRYSGKITSYNSIDEFLNAPEALKDMYDIEEMIVFEYMIKDFAKYMKKEGIMPNKISNYYIENYIVKIPKLSNKTMQQRKAALQSFLSYIDTSTKQEHFKSSYWELKSYKTPKNHNTAKKLAFDKELLNNLLLVLNNYHSNIDPRTGEKFKKRWYAHSEHTAYKNTLLILIMMYGGARAGEVVKIRFEDIKKTKGKNDTPMYSISVLGKGNKNRNIYVKEHLLKKHIDYLIEHKGKNKYISGKKNSEAPISTQALYYFSREMFKFAGSEKKGLHIFRHHFASKVMEDKGDIKLLQELLGHSSVTTTMIYSDISEQSIIDAMSV